MLTELAPSWPWRAVVSRGEPHATREPHEPHASLAGVGVTLFTQIPIKIEIKIQILGSEKISTFSPEGQLLFFLLAHVMFHMSSS